MILFTKEKRLLIIDINDTLATENKWYIFTAISTIYKKLLLSVFLNTERNLYTVGKNNLEMKALK